MAGWGGVVNGMKIVYLVMSILGFILPYYIFIDWLLINGFDITLFLNEIIKYKISAFAWSDVVVSAIVLIIFIIHDGKVNSIKNIWIPILATLTVGVSFGLPLFLLMREYRLNN